MKKLIFAFLSILAVCCTTAFAAPDLEFTPQEGGKYIYCNNREFIYREDVADVSNQNPKFIMSNENMGADKYTLFASHVNHTEVKNHYGLIIGKGFDVELDVMFHAKEDTTITISALGFEVPDNVTYYINQEELTTEKDWGCFTAWASYLGTEISRIDSGEKYEPVPFEAVTFTIPAGETVYLNKFIPNYRAVPVWRPVHLMADLEILSGVCDINVLAVRSLDNTPGNRKNVSRNIAFGSFVPQYEMKGIANSKNAVDAYVDLTIPADITDGTKLPVTVYNRYAPEGNTVTTWYTNLNPTSDLWNKSNVAESCMLAFEYKDPSKKKYYGSGVSEDKKDDVWHFDTKHALMWEYKPKVSKNRRGFVPNFEITDEIPEEYCNSLGNYGVFQNYHLSVKNEGYTDRWFNYCLNTGANNLIILYDEFGNICDGYPLTKGTVGVKESDKLVSLKIPAQETVKFTLSVILTTNHPGGMENSFMISDVAYPVRTYDADYIRNVRDTQYTGKEFIRFDNDTLYTSTDRKNWTAIQISDAVRRIFEISGEICVTYTGNGYIINNRQHSGIPYYSVRDFYREVWALDESFNLLWQHNFSIYPTKTSGAFGIYYMRAGSNYYSRDGQSWSLLGGGLNLPCYNFGRFAASARGGNICLSENGTDFFDVLYEGKKPLYIDSLGDIYYYISGNDIYVSAEGVYFEKLTSPEKILKLGRIGNNLLINDTLEIPLPELCRDNFVLKSDNKYLGFKNPPIFINDAYYIPIRSYAELLGGSVLWNNETKTATITVGEKVMNFTEGANNTIIYEGKMMAPSYALE